MTLGKIVVTCTCFFIFLELFNDVLFLVVFLKVREMIHILTDSMGSLISKSQMFSLVRVDLCLGTRSRC